MKKHKYDIIVLLAVISFSISLFLAITHYMGFTVPCSVTHGCDTVLHSKYSTLLGLPLSVWGVGFNLAVIFFALMANHYAKARKFLTIILTVGAILAAIFLCIQFFVIKQICQYCLTTDLVTIIVFLWNLNISA